MSDERDLKRVIVDGMPALNRPQMKISWSTDIRATLSRLARQAESSMLLQRCATSTSYAESNNELATRSKEKKD